MLKFRVTYRLGTLRYQTEVAARDDFQARMAILVDYGMQPGEEEWLNPDFWIDDVLELPMDYPVKEGGCYARIECRLSREGDNVRIETPEGVLSDGESEGREGAGSKAGCYNVGYDCGGGVCGLIDEPLCGAMS